MFSGVTIVVPTRQLGAVFGGIFLCFVGCRNFLWSFSLCEESSLWEVCGNLLSCVLGDFGPSKYCILPRAMCSRFVVCSPGWTPEVSAVVGFHGRWSSFVWDLRMP